MKKASWIIALAVGLVGPATAQQVVDLVLLREVLLPPRACLSAGKHVFIEKPMARTEAEAEELASFAEHQGLGSVLGKPAVAHIAHDGQHPGTRVSAAEPANVLEGAQRGLLYDILRVHTATGNPAREPEGIDEVRQEHLGKSGLITRVVHIWAG